MTRRVAALAALGTLLVACSAGHDAASRTTTTTTTTTVTSTTLGPGGTEPDGSTTTTGPPPPPTPQGFQTRRLGVLLIGTEQLTAPWNTGPDAADITGGFDFRLGRELGSRLGVPNVRVVPTSLLSMMTGQDCGCDIIISNVTVTSGRARSLDLSVPYLDADQALVVKTGSAVSTLTQAAGLRWGVAVRNPAGLDVMANQVKPVTAPFVTVNDDDLVRGIADGRLDGAVMAVPDALALVAANPALAIAGRVHTGEQYAVALSLGSANTAVVNDVVTSLRDDGTIDALVRTYLGARPSDIPLLTP